jgi:DNA-binding MarR family transcriptional regulator/GNAT superfamily N-acetyltransferase
MTEAIAQVRAFNRTVTQRIGALREEYLARARPLGASRLLWEIGPDGTDVRTLRDRLDLDSGYLSRLLRRLELDDLVVVEPTPADQRVRVVRLTTTGEAEREELDRRSDDLARSLLAPLTPGQQTRLVEAMATVGQLLTAGLVEIAPADPGGPDATYCLRSYVAELAARFESGFDPRASIPAPIDSDGVLLLARLHGEPVGCVALLRGGPETASVKRMWVAPAARGLGVGRRLLTTVEHHAAGWGIRTLRLETNRTLTEAIALYRASGYVEVPPFNDERYAHHWFTKQLDPFGP